MLMIFTLGRVNDFEFEAEIQNFGAGVCREQEEQCGLE